MQALLVAWVGYWIGIGIELGIIVIAGVVLALLLTGVLFRMIVAIKEKLAASKVERERKAAERAAEKQRQKEAAEAAAAEAAAAELAAAEAEALAEEEAAQAAEAQAAESAASASSAAGSASTTSTTATTTEASNTSTRKATSTTTTTTTTTVVEESETAEAKADKKSRKKGGKKVEEAEAEQAAGEVGAEVVYVQGDGVVFNESKTITELYEELSAEQKSYFDELREEALTKPDSELSITRNFVSVKIGKRNLLKLLIKRGVTVAEFMLENEQLKQLRLSDKNKRGKSTIKVKPTVVQVLDLPSLKVAVDMINLAYEELMLDD